MIQMRSILDVADNSGARKIAIINPIGGSTGRYARLGEEHMRRAPEPALRMRALRHLARAARRTKRTTEARDYLNRAVFEARKANLPNLVEELTTEIRALPSS